ncbi:MAG: sugar ABC transporter substrate-binding protein, partial [Pseudomonadota bacterium]|nr:sugar ABC transporter substrate-binding protein [Pseudomonadota bacterium]
VETEGATCILGANPGWLGAQAIKLAIDILEGNKPADRHVLVNADFLTTDTIESELYPENDTMQTIEAGVNAFPDLAPGLTLPISPDWMEITPQEAAGS